MLDIAFTVQAPVWKTLLTAEKKFFKHALQTACDALELPAKKLTVSLVFADDGAVQELNHTYRHQNKPTNVLSFPLIEDFSDLPPMDDIELGDIVLAYETIAREAAEQGKTMRDHTAHLLAHGLLHLFGYDHMSKADEQQMEALEIAILKELGIADPYC